jgi:hypothetical protein
VAKQPIKFYTRNQSAASITAFIAARKINNEEFFPVKVDGEEKLLSSPQLQALKGAFKAVVKCGNLKESDREPNSLVWSLTVTAVIVNTTLEVEDDLQTAFKFAKHLSI